MVMRSATQSVSKGGTWKGMLFLTVLVILSVLNVNVSGQSISLIFLPVIAIFLWPRVENPMASIIVIFMFGLISDIISAGPLGLWPLIYLGIFTIFRPHKRMKSRRFGASFMGWLGALALTFAAAYLLGWFALERRPELPPLIFSAIASIIAFPLGYGLRHLGRQITSDSDARGL